MDVDLAKEFAQKSFCLKKHGCIVFRDKKMLSVACNSYVVKKKPNTSCYTIHAEMAALKKMNYSSSFERKMYKKANILVVRVDGQGNLKNSKPCSDCLCRIKNIKSIKTIYFSDDDGQIVSFSKNDINNEHISHGHRRRKN